MGPKEEHMKWEPQSGNYEIGHQKENYETHLKPYGTPKGNYEMGPQKETMRSN